MTAHILHFPRTNRNQPLPASRPTLSGLARRLVAGLAQSDRRHLERRYLAEMDDRTLRDIGVTRADVAAELRRSIGWTSPLLRG